MNLYDRYAAEIALAAPLIAMILLWAMLLARPWFIATFGVSTPDGLTP